MKKKKIQFFSVIINLFQVNAGPLQMVNENCLVFEYHFSMFILLPATREFKDVMSDNNI